MVNKFRAPALILFVYLTSQPAPGQTSAPPTARQTTPGVIKLTGEDEKRVKQLESQIDPAAKADRWAEAIAGAEELLALRTRAQGPKHLDTVGTEWQVKALRQVARMPKEDRVAFLSVSTIYEQAHALFAQRKYAQAQPLYEKALAINRRLLTDDHPETAASYEFLAYDLDRQAKYADAQRLLEKALDIRRRLLGEDHPHTGGDYRALGMMLDYQGKYREAQPFHEKALEIRRRLFTGDAADTAQAYNTAGYNLRAQGKFALAQPLFEQALAMNRRLFSDDRPETALSYNNVAANLWSQGKYASAQPYFEKALEISRRLLTDNDPATALSYVNLAANLSAQGQYAAAQPLNEKALEIRRRLLTDDHPDTASSYESLAANLRQQGLYAAAQPLNETALRIRRRLLSDDHPDTASSFNSLVGNLGGQGNYAAAQPFFEKALEIRRRLLTDDHPDTALAYRTLGMNLTNQGKHAAAKPLLEKALEIDRRLLTDNHPATASAFDALALNLHAQRNYAAAQPLFEKALEIRRRLLTEDHPETAASYNNVAYGLNGQRNFVAAQPLLEKALEIHRRLLTDLHPQTVASYNNVATNLRDQGKYALAQRLHEKTVELSRRLLTDLHPDSVLRCSNLALNLYAQGKYEEARDRWLAAAKSQEAARLRVAFAGLERVGPSFALGTNLPAVLARLGQPEEAWQHLEEYLGRGLLDELAARSDLRLSLAERTRLRELVAEAERLDRVVESAPKGLDQAERANRFEELRRQRELAGIALGEFQATLARDYGPLAGRVADRQEIQSALPTDAALITWVDIPPVGPLAADPDGEHWGVVLRARGVPAWAPISGTGPNGLWSKDDAELAGRARAELRNRSGMGLQSLLEHLRTQRLGPLTKALAAADGLPPARRLIVLPSLLLGGIPIEALLAADDTRTVSYAPSGTVFKYLRKQPRADRHAGLLALGDPAFGGHDTSYDPMPVPDHGLLLKVVARGSNAANHGLKEGDVLLAYNGQTLNKMGDLKVVAEGEKAVPVEVWRDGRSSRRDLGPGKLGVILDPQPAPKAIGEQRKLQRLLTAARSGDEDFAPLPGTRHEVEALAHLFKSDDRPVRAFFGAEASEPEMDHMAAAGALKQFGFIHLATHGVIDEDIPTRSAVILTQTGLPDPLEQALNHKPVFDGRLNVREIQHGWELNAELVTLSACETALGRDQGGEGFVGFSQALLMSGTRSVCLSLWKVDDTATALLMQRFYANMLGRGPGPSSPMRKAESLSEAKAWLRELKRKEVLALTAEMSGGVERSKGAKARTPAELAAAMSAGGDNDRPYAHPHFWAAFVLVGDPD
jgi:tetratricopeptide (TPR) repeat protein